jgi:hypothetical protein
MPHRKYDENSVDGCYEKISMKISVKRGMNVDECYVEKLDYKSQLNSSEKHSIERT